jgi:hypothetical protein
MEDVIIRLRGVSRSYPRFDLGPVDLDVSEGSVVGLVGLIAAVVALMMAAQARKTSFV